MNRFSANIATKVTVLNFTVTMEGLSDQLLGIVVTKERPDLEEQRNKLLVENAYNSKRLKETEDEILQAMAGMT